MSLALPHAVPFEPLLIISDDDLAAASTQLAQVVQTEADVTAARVGFGWAPSSIAPDCYEPLRAAFRRSKRTGLPLPVSDQHCEQTIFGSPEANIAMRFWHDVHHVERGCDFTPLQEIELALWHLDVIEQRGLPPGSLPWRLLHGDLIGQTYCSALLGYFPADQRRFVLDCVTRGLDLALLNAQDSVPEACAA